MIPLNTKRAPNTKRAKKRRGPLKRKRRGGGERKRKAKHAAAARAAKEERYKNGDAQDERGGGQGMFGFLNRALGGCLVSIKCINVCLLARMNVAC